MKNKSKLDQRDKDLPLRNDIHRLGDLLGTTLKHWGGEKLFATEEQVRALCKKLRASEDRQIEHQLKKLLRGLSLDHAIGVIRAFSVYFQLANIAEQHHRIRRKRFLRTAHAKPATTRVAGRHVEAVGAPTHRARSIATGA
jgi:phosphoenolpyruvate carboxylase